MVSSSLLISMTRTDCFTLSKCSVEIAVEVCVLFLRLDLIDVPAPDSGAERPLASETRKIEDKCGGVSVSSVRRKINCLRLPTVELVSSSLMIGILPNMIV